MIFDITKKEMSTFVTGISYAFTFVPWATIWLTRKIWPFMNQFCCSLYITSDRLASVMGTGILPLVRLWMLRSSHLKERGLISSMFMLLVYLLAIDHLCLLLQTQHYAPLLAHLFNICCSYGICLPPFWKSPFSYVLTLVCHPSWMGFELVFILYCIVHSPQPDCSALYAACRLTHIDWDSMTIQRSAVFFKWEAGLPEMYIKQPCSTPIIISYLLHTLLILTSLKSPLASLSDVTYQKECMGP